MRFCYSVVAILPLILSLTIGSAYAKNRAAELNRLNQEEENDRRQPVDYVYQVQTSVGQLPPEIRAMDSRLKKANRRATYVVTVGMVNDNWNLRNSRGDGDDFGLTFGYFMKVNRLTSNGMMLTLSYSEDLYAENLKRPVKMGDRRYTTQKTETETVLELLLDNSNQGHTFFYSIGGGWQRLNPSGDTMAANIQGKWHKLTNLSRQVINERGDLNDEGFFVDAAGGVQHSGHLGSLQTHVQGSVGFRESQVEGASYYSGNVEASAQYQYESGRATRAVVGDTMRFHDQGVEQTGYFRLEAVGKHFTCGLGVSQVSGDVMNYQGYNLPNKSKGQMDMITTTYCQKKF